MKPSNCTLCGFEVFSKNGRKIFCKDCLKIKKKEYDLKYCEINKERKRKQHKEYYEENKDKIKEYSKNPESIARRKRNFQKPKNKAKRKEYLARRETIEMRKKWSKEYNIKNSEALKIKHKEYRRNNKEKEQKYFKEYYQRPETKVRLKEYYEENSQRISKRCKEYNQRPEVKEKRKIYQQTPEAIVKRKKYWGKPEVKERVKKYNQNPKTKARAKEYRNQYKQKPEVIRRGVEYRKKYNKIPKNKERKTEWTRNQWHTNSHFRIKSLIRHRFYILLENYLKKKKLKPCKEYGVDYLAIMEHLKPFPKDMHLYHIDHIRPLKSFNFINEDDSINLEEIQLAFAPENHQWLLAHDNLTKNSKWEKQAPLMQVG